MRVTSVSRVPILLRRRSYHSLRAATPFNFRLSLWKPSHFATGLEIHTETDTWRTMRLQEHHIGLRLTRITARDVGVAIYSESPLSPVETGEILGRVGDAYGFRDNVSHLEECIERNGFTDLARLRGMRISCPESVFEIAIISLLLQNTTIARTTQMFTSLLNSYGSLVRFDGVILRSFFTASDIRGVRESDLRAENRLGYRAKYFPEFAEFFGSWVEPPRRSTLKKAQLISDLQCIKGVGEYSSNVIASHALRDESAVPLDVWNVRILHQALFDEPGEDRETVLTALSEAFPRVEGLAALYFVESAYLDDPLDPLAPSAAAARSRSCGHIC